MTRNYDGFWINQEADLENSEGPREVALLEVLLDQPHHVSRLDFNRHRESLTCQGSGTGPVSYLTGSRMSRTTRIQDATNL